MEEVPVMRTDIRTPMVPCMACGIVPALAYNTAAGEFSISCPCCGRSVSGPFEADARGAWAELNAKPPAPLTPALELLDSIEEAMCDLEAIRTVPGAMTAWHRWMDAYRELRMILLEAGA